MRTAILALCLILPAAHPALASPPPCQSRDHLWQANIIDDGTGGVLEIRHGDARALAHRRPLIDRDHGRSRSAALIYHEGQNACLAALSDAPELWLIALDPDAGPYYDGFVHSYSAGMEESLASEQGRFARLRIDLTLPLTDMSPAPDDPRAVEGWRADGSCVRVHLIAKREIGPCPDGGDDNE